MCLRNVLATSAAISAGALLVACVATEAPPPARGVIVNGPPPQPIAETAPPAPAQDAMWVEGYWHWTGTQYAWIPGHWERPAQGNRWMAPRYSVVNGNYTYEPGAWMPAGPPPPSPNRQTLR